MTEALDHLYAEIQTYLESVRQTLDAGGAIDDSLKGRMLQNFNVNLYYTRTVVKHRVDCFADFSTIDVIFEEMEDDLATALDELDLGQKHPEVLAAYVAKGSSGVIKILLGHESTLANTGGRLKASWRWCRAKLARGRSNSVTPNPPVGPTVDPDTQSPSPQS